MNGDCELSTVTGIAPGDSLGNITTGMVGLSHPPLAKFTPYIPSGATDGARVLNLGQAGEAARTLFDVVNAQLRTTDLFANAPAVPIAQNVVLLKAQYGVDCLGNGVITWTTAVAGGACGFDYTPGGMTLAPPPPGGWTAANLARIRAVRIGIVVRSDEPDPKDPALVGQTATLFDCSAHTAAACQGWNPITSAVLQDGWRYRTYETIVPMRNAIYNNGT